MPRLDQRLQAVAQFIRSDVHVDIGSDHGHLLFSLLKSDRIRHGIAIENKKQPWINSTVTLAKVDAEVRFGDGLEPLQPGEADSLSICGMGAQSLVRILTQHPERLPKRLVLQPNQEPEWVRRWAFENGYHLTDEVTVGRRWFDVLVFVCADDRQKEISDPVYEGLDLGSAFLFGPWHIRRRDPVFVERLRTERAYYSRLPGKTVCVQSRLDAIQCLLSSAPRCT